MKNLIIFFSLMWLLSANVVFASDWTDRAWFKVQLEFDTTGLPQGVSIIKKEGGWFIRNQSATPLYLLEKKKTESYINSVKINVFPESKIPSEFVPINKLISNEVYYLRSTWNDGKYRGVVNDPEGKYYGIEKLSDNCQKDGCIICEKDSCDPSMLELDNYFLNQLGIQPTKNIRQMNRPDSLVIPEPESFKLLVYYGNKPIEIKGKFVYSLNDDYEK